MPVEKDINLDKPLSDEDIRELEAEADRLEQLAQEAQDDAKKAKEFQKEEEKLLNDSIKKIEQLEKEAEKAEKARLKIGRSIKEVNELAQHRSALSQFGGAEEFSEEEGFGMGGMIPGSGQIQRGRTGFGTGQERSALGNLVAESQKFQARMLEAQKQAEEDRKALKKAQREAQKQRAENAKAIAENKKMIGTVQADFQKGLAFTRNPMGFAVGNLKGMIGAGGIAGMIALVALAIAEQVFDEVKKMYGPGGVFDIRKQMLDRDKEVAEFHHILDRRAGRVFFTGDIELSQSAPEYSNTERLRDRMSRYQALHLGE